MKKLFLFLLKRYTRTEAQRLEVFAVLHDKVSETYSEQTPYGNVYNAHIEFCMAQPFIKKLVEDKKYDCLDMTKSGIGNAFNDAVRYLEPKGRYVDGRAGFIS